MTVLREFIRHFPRFKRQAEAGKTVVLVDRQGRRFLFRAERPARSSGSARHLSAGDALSPEPTPREEWKENW